MSVSEYQRHQLFQWFEEAMGPERSAALMGLLPPVGWGDIATGTELRGEVAQIRGEMARFEGRMEHSFARLRLHLYLTAIASNATIAGVVLAATQLG